MVQKKQTPRKNQVLDWPFKMTGRIGQQGIVEQRNHPHAKGKSEECHSSLTGPSKSSISIKYRSLSRTRWIAMLFTKFPITVRFVQPV